MLSDVGVYEGFKETEIGPIPLEWEVVRLGEVLDQVDVRVDDYNGSEARDFPVLSLTKNQGLILQNERFKKRIALEDVGKYKVVQRGQIVHNPYVIWEGAIHMLRHFEYGLVSPVYPVWQVFPDKADSFFVDQLLRMPIAIAAYNRFASGVVNRRRSIRQRDFLSIQIPLPPLPEQQAIAHVLRTVQEAKEATARVIAALRELKKSLMQHLFTYGPMPLDQADQIPLKETEIGSIPAHWEVVRLGDYLDLIRNGLTRRQNKDGKGCPVTRIETIAEDRINSTKVGYVENVTQKEIEKFRLHPGDILFSHINSEPQLGRSVVYESTPPVLLHGMNLLRLRTQADKLNPCFLNFLFAHYRQLGLFIGIASRAVNQSSINQGKMKALRIPLPLLDEQRRIAHMLSAADRKIESEENSKAALEAVFKTLLHHLMRGKVRVEPRCEGADDVSPRPREGD